MSEITEKTTIIIKGRFKATASSSFGVFIVFMDNSSKNIEKFDVVASHFSTLYENNISIPWNEIENLITKLKWKGEYATSLTHDVQATLEDLFQAGTGRSGEIWSNIKKLQFNKVENIFEEVLARPTSDKNIKVDIAIETLPSSQIEAIRKNKAESGSKDILSALTPSSQQENQQKQEKESYIPEDSAVLLEVSLVLSPVSGVPVYELKEGDKIFIKITEQSNRGQYFIDLLNASQDGEILPIPATVVKVTKEGKIYVVIVNIGPGIYGKSLDEDTVKVKMYDPMLDKRKQKSKIPEKQITENLNIEKKAKALEIPFHFIFIAIGIIAIILLGMLIILLV